MRPSTRGQTELHESSRSRPRSPDARAEQALARAESPHPASALQRIARDPSSRGGRDILALQGAIGNQVVQRRVSRSRAEPRPHLPADGGGRAMPPAVQAKMERAFGTDFSAVRIYEGPRATALGALAYTQGSEVHFASGHYQPNSPAGQALLGHELAHTVQQRQGRVPTTLQLKGVGVNDDAALEREADVAGARAARGDLALAGSDRSAIEAGSLAARAERPSAPLAAPIQRVVAPRISKETPEAQAASDRELQDAYDAVWQHLWRSPAARHIYASVHAHPDTVHVRVGAPDTKVRRNGAGGAAGGVQQLGVAGDWDMEWHPWLFGTIADQARTPLTANGARVAPGHMTGTLSPAVLLLHEFGHVQQDIEAEQFGQGATPFGGGATTTPWGDIMEMEVWVHNLHTALHWYQGKVGLPLQALPHVHNEVIEGDNVSRHERKVQDDLREPTRAEYANTLVFGDLQPLAQRVLNDAGFDPRRPARQLRASVSRAVRFQAGPPLNQDTIVDHLNLLDQQFRAVRTHNAGLNPSLLAPFPLTKLNGIITHLGQAQAFWTQQQQQLQQARQQANAPGATPTFAHP